MSLPVRNLIQDNRFLNVIWVHKSALSREQFNSVLRIPKPYSDQCFKRDFPCTSCSRFDLYERQKAPLYSDSSWWLHRGPQRRGRPRSPSPLCVRLWRRNEIDAFPQIIFPRKQAWLLLWRSCWWMGGSHRVTQQHLPSYSRARQSQVHNLEQRGAPSPGTLVLVHRV